MRYAAGIEYCGGAYSGWQRQHHATTVQGCLEAALSSVANADIQTVCAGRTDAGVHATAQVVHFDSPQTRDERAWCFGTNTLLPADISVRWACPVESDFHARFSALSRRYTYVIMDRRNRSGLSAGRVCWSRQALDAQLMNEAAQALIGEQDFSSFRASECQSNTAMRNVMEVVVSRQGDCVLLQIEANAFLHHMVRNIAGSLMQIGSGRRPKDWIGELLALRDRNQGDATAAAQGLYLTAVRYPDIYHLPVSTSTPLLAMT